MTTNDRVKYNMGLIFDHYSKFGLDKQNVLSFDQFDSQNQMMSLPGFMRLFQDFLQNHINLNKNKLIEIYKKIAKNGKNL